MNGYGKEIQIRDKQEQTMQGGVWQTGALPLYTRG